MTLPRFYALRRYWARHPPTHVLLAAWVGYKPPPEARAPGEAAKRITSQEDLMSFFGGII